MLAQSDSIAFTRLHSGSLLATLVVWTSAMQCQEPALRGLRELSVYVPAPAGAAVKAGLDSTTIGNIIELRLRQAGLLVVQGTPTTPGKPVYLRYSIDCVERPDGRALACAVALTLKDVVFLRDDRGPSYADVWTRSFVQIATATTVGDLVRKATQELSDDFVLDWLRENPRR